MATRTLNFYAYNLQKDTTVMLTFQPPNTEKLFKDQFPVVWKIIKFKAGEHSKTVVRYCARLAFGYAQTGDGNIVDSSGWIEIKGGEVVSVNGRDGNIYFGPVTVQDGSKLLMCKNSTNQRVNLNVGFVKGDGIDQRFDPTLLWTGVGSKSNITAQFTPVLSAYVTNDYKESQYLRGEIETDAIWTQDLNILDDVTSWYFCEDGESGEFRFESSS